MTDDQGVTNPIQAAQTRIVKLKHQLEIAEQALYKLQIARTLVDFCNQDDRLIQLGCEAFEAVDRSKYPNGIPLHIRFNATTRRFEPDVQGFEREMESPSFGQIEELPSTKSNGRPYMRRRRARGNGRCPQEKDYYVPILKALKHFGWAATPEQVTPLVREWMRPRLSQEDFDWIPSGIFIRWECRMRFARKRMVMNDPPLLIPDSPKGIWQATDGGKIFLEEHEAVED